MISTFPPKNRLEKEEKHAKLSQLRKFTLEQLFLQQQLREEFVLLSSSSSNLPRKTAQRGKFHQQKDGCSGCWEVEWLEWSEESFVLFS